MFRRTAGQSVIYKLIRPFAFAVDAETAHRATIRALRLVPPRDPPRFAPSLASDVAGLAFPSPVGLAAGFDKDGEVPDAMLGLGFGFVEVGEQWDDEDGLEIVYEVAAAESG